MQALPRMYMQLGGKLPTEMLHLVLIQDPVAPISSRLYGHQVCCGCRLEVGRRHRLYLNCIGLAGAAARPQSRKSSKPTNTGAPQMLMVASQVYHKNIQ